MKIKTTTWASVHNRTEQNQMSCKTYHIYHTFLLPKKHPAIGIDFQKGNLSASQKHEQSDFDLEDSQFKNNTRVHATTSNEVKKGI